MNEKEYKENFLKEGRATLIDSILDQYIKQKGKNKTKVSIFIGGGSCSGKSTFRSTLLRNDEELNDFLVIDSDELKELIPEYLELINSGITHSASIVHEESSDMATKLVIQAIEKELSFLYDATLKNTEKYIDLFEKLKQAGFKIQLVILTVPLDEAFRRNRARYEYAKNNNSSPRLVPESIISKSHQEIKNSFDKLQYLCDVWTIFDTRGNAPILVARKDEVSTEIIHEEFYLEFITCKL